MSPSSELSRSDVKPTKCLVTISVLSYKAMIFKARKGAGLETIIKILKRARSSESPFEISFSLS